ncbi:response regulator [Desulfosediminicola flagellatus]|uniref:response regulator n=1 Tax=Desulfosediminicola flagellatus TaxID=2569541 RepID=UPI0010ACC084|nr:response regulator [Desulfosediminicola flagellatus]
MIGYGFSDIYSASLKYKILFGFLFSMLPLLAIVVITHFPARNSTTSSSNRQITLISNSGAEKLDVLFRSGSNTFSEWVEEDVFGMAIEFNALDELGNHFATLQASRPEFLRLVLTDAKGVVISENHSARSRQSAKSTQIGQLIPEFEYIRNSRKAYAHIVPSVDNDNTGTRGQFSILYSFRTQNSSGEHNGFFLAYRDMADFQETTDSIYSELKKSGFTTSRVAIMAPQKDEFIEYSAKLSPQEQPIATPIETVIRKSIGGEIGVYTTGKHIEHIVYIPLKLNPGLIDSADFSRNDPGLCMITAVDEGEIMSKVKETLLMSVIIGSLGVLAIITISYFTIRSIIGPIGNLVNVLQRYGSGDSEVRAEVRSHDEIGYLTREFNAMLEQINSSGTALQESESRYRVLFDGLRHAINKKNYTFRFPEQSRDDELAISLNRMLETLERADNRTQDEDWLKTGLTHLNEKISGEHKLEDLCDNAIRFIAEYTGAKVGTFFVRSGEGNYYELLASYAFRLRKGLSNRCYPGEGLTGQAALEKKVIVFNDIPEDYIWIESSVGSSPPVNLLVIPLIYEGVVQGLIELGTSHPFSRRDLNFAEQVSSVVAVAINGAIANDRLKELLGQTREQSETLRQQQEKLQKANDELQDQTQILKESEARLQVQQEELQTSNEEMEEKNQLLEEQKKENEITNRNLIEKQMEIEENARQLQIATKYKSEFLSNMSHELRTPLNSILLLAKMLSENDEKNLTEDQIESAASIHRGGQTLLHLINDILDLSKIEAGKVELSLSQTSPETITTNFQMEFNHLAKSKGLTFITEVGEGAPNTFITDVHRLDQILRNLLGNAFKFTEHGTVTLRIARPDADISISREDLDINEAIAITVSDTGLGIPKEKRDVIFEAFRQVDGSITRRHGGTGLGLSISRELANLIGGEIFVKSTPQQGTVFTLCIPTTLESPDHSESLPASEPHTPEGEVIRQPTVPAISDNAKVDNDMPIPTRKDKDTQIPDGRRMLIIEDDREFASILSGFFEKNGYETIIASNGELGMKYAIEQMPTAIILDIGLPGIDGWTVLNELKNNLDTRHIPVHIMSGHDESSEGLKKGAVGYLTKPVDTDGLKSALGKIEQVLDASVKELLVVEDDDDLRSSILKVMNTKDVHATTAETGKDAIRLLKENRFDCMILDLGLPDISGFTLLDNIENDTTISKLPIIIYTGRDLTRDETERLDKYSNSIVLKSAFSMERLLDETSLFMHRVEQDMPESHRKIIQEIRDKDSGLKDKQVLLVDDDMRNAFALSKFLKSKGLSVTIADNGKKALELLETEVLPNIVLMDVMMPVMDGYEAMKEIRKRGEWRDLPIIALTAKAMDTDREECIRCGANDYLSKPIDTKKLLSMLRIWMY